MSQQGTLIPDQFFHAFRIISLIHSSPPHSRAFPGFDPQGFFGITGQTRGGKPRKLPQSYGYKTLLRPWKRIPGFQQGNLGWEQLRMGDSHPGHGSASRECSHPSPGPSGSSPALLCSGASGSPGMDTELRESGLLQEPGKEGNPLDTGAAAWPDFQPGSIPNRGVTQTGEQG